MKIMTFNVLIFKMICNVVQEVNESQMDTSSAYMLFYEREGLCQQQYMPNVAGKTPDTRDLEDEFDSDLKKMCSVM